MQNFGLKIQRYLKNDKNAKQYRVLVVVLSLVVAVSVFAGLIMPAISLTDSKGNEYPYNYSDATELVSGLTVNSTEPYHFQPTITNISLEASESAKDENGDLIANSDGSVSFDFAMNWRLPQGILDDNPYIYCDIDDLVLNGSAVIDIPDGGLPTDGALGNVTMNGKVVGTYRIEDNGLVVICFTDADFISDNASDEWEPAQNTCYLTFTADLSLADGNDSGEAQIKTDGEDTTGQTIEGLQYASVTLDKSGTDTKDGYIKWTVEVSNPLGLNLEGLTLDDTLFDDDTIITSDYGTYENGVFTFNSSTNGQTSFTITYKTKLTADDLIKSYASKTNEVTLKEPDGDQVRKDTATVSYTNGFKISKTGMADYGKGSNASYSDKITWTVTIDNLYGVDWSGFKIEDSLLGYLSYENYPNTDFSNATFQVTTSSGTTTLTGSDFIAQYVSESNYVYDEWNPTYSYEYLTLTNASDITQIVITYTTDAQNASENDYKNTATLTNDTSSIDASASVPQNQFSLSKTGSANTLQMTNTWTITLIDNVSDDGVGLKDAEIYDEAFAYIDNFTIETSYGATVEYEQIYDTLGEKVIGIRITNISDTDTFVTIKYTTDADDADMINAGLITQDLSGNFTTNNTATGIIGTLDYEAEKEVTYYTNNVTLQKSGVTQTLSSDKKSLTQSWTVTIEGEKGTLSSKTFNDIMTATVNNESVETHTITADQLAAAQIKVRVFGSESYVDYDKATHGSITLETTDDGFKVVTGDDLDNIIGIQIVYSSTVDISKYDAGTTITYINTITDGINSRSSTREYTIVNDNCLDKSLVGGSDSALDITDFATTINGEKCYLIRWKVTFNENKNYSNNTSVTLTDTLPKYFKLYTEAIGNNSSVSNLDESAVNLVYWGYGWDKTNILERYSGSVNAYAPKYSVADNGDDTQTVTFYISATGVPEYFIYAAYITVDDYVKLLEENGSTGVTISNTISTDDGETSTSVQEFEPVAINPDDSVITKSAEEQTVSGYMNYTVDFNPDGQNLSTGDTLTLVDILNFTQANSSVVDSDLNSELYPSIAEINIYSVDENGNKTKLNTDYTYETHPVDTEIISTELNSTTFNYYSNNIYAYSSSETTFLENTDVTLTITGTANGVADSLTVFVGIDNVNSPVYSTTYADNFDEDGNLTLTFNTGTYSGEIYVLDWSTSGLYSASKITSASISAIQNVSVGAGRLTVEVPDETHIVIEYRVKASYSDSGHDNMGISNTISTSTIYGDAYDDSWSVYNANNDSSAGVDPTGPIKITKVDASNISLLLEAEFEIYRFNFTSNSWQQGTNLSVVSNELTVGSWAYSMNNTGEGTTFTTTSESTAISFQPDTTTTYLYALVEKTQPTGYSDSNVGKIVYFAYKQMPSLDSIYDLATSSQTYTKPTASDIQLIASGETLSVKNSKPITVNAEKTWTDGNDNHASDSITLTLYYSTKKVETGIPDDAVKVANSEKTLDSSSSWKAVWTDLPSANDSDQTLYYYVKETSTTNTGYTVNYSNNGSKGESTIEVINSTGLTIEKSWLASDGSDYTDQTNETSVEVKLLRSTVKPTSQGFFPEKGEYEEIGTYNITKDNDWKLCITNNVQILEQDDDDNPYYYYVQETAITGYNAIYSINGVVSTGIITLKNQVESSTGAELPSTGGTGTGKFAAAGAIMTCTAATLLVTKCRKRAKRKSA